MRFDQIMRGVGWAAMTFALGFICGVAISAVLQMVGVHSWAANMVISTCCTTAGMVYAMREGYLR